MHTTPTRVHRIVLTAVLAGLAALALAACGSSSSSSSSAAAAGTSSSTTTSGSAASRGRNSAAFATFQSCLKQHGVTLPQNRADGRPPSSANGSSSGTATTPGRRAGGGGGYGFFGGGQNANSAQSKKMRAAMTACRKDLPKGSFRGRPGGGGGAGGGHFSTATLQTFTACVKQHGFTLPKPNTSGKGAVFPRSIESNKTFQKAAKSCQSLLRPTGGGGSPAA